MKPKLCYVLSHYNPRSSTHYYHHHELIALLAKNNDIFFFAESGQRQVKIKGINQYYVQKYSFFPLKLLERVTIIFITYLQGYHKFYCHYADFTTIICSLFTRLFGGTTFKWHCVQEHYYQKPFALRYLKEKLLREVPLYISLRATQHLVTSSIQMKKYYHRHFRIRQSKIIVIPNFINLHRFTPTRSKTALKKQLKLPPHPLALFVHRLSKRKGADRLISYAQTIKQKNINLTILAIGTGPLLCSLQQQTKKLSLSTQLIFLGPIPNQLLPQYYQAAHVFIMPSRVEEFARVQLEAMASGLPIIATKTMATEAMLNRTQKQLVVTQSNHHSIPLITHQLISNRSQYRVMITTGLHQVKNFSLPLIAQKFQRYILDEQT